MNKINIYVLTFFLSLAGVSIYAQNNRSQVVITSGQDNNVFFHTIERGQTVYESGGIHERDTYMPESPATLLFRGKEYGRLRMLRRLPFQE